jgi:predicted Zn-dependent protease
MMNKKLYSALLLAFGLTLISSCGDQGSSGLLGGAKDLFSGLLIPPEKERELGVEFNKQIQDGANLGEGESIFVPANAQEQSLLDYVDSLGHLIVDQISQDDLDDLLPEGMEKHDFFNFTIIRSEQVNAFAVPGGFVYFYTGILSTMKDESELVAVLGHEIAHIVAHHSRDRIMTDVAVSAALDAFLGGESGASVLIAQLGAGYFTLENGRGDELESDSLGIRYSADAGVNPGGIQSYFGAGIVDDSGKCDEGFLTDITGVFSTHPANCERVAQAKRIEARYSTEVKNQPKNEAQYQDKVLSVLTGG